MISEVKIASLILAGLLSCQSAPAMPPETQPPAETEAAEPMEVLEPMELYAEWLPLSCTAVLPKEKMGLCQIDQVPGHEKFPHTFMAYLPPDYDPFGQYDLLIFLGPYDGRQGDCMDKYQSTWYTEIFRFRTVFDHLILEKKARPFIMIQPDYLQYKDLEINYENIALNIKEELLPYVAEHYATYAEDGSYESLTAARDHIAMGGCSLGGMYTFLGLLPNCTDVASFFCPMSCNINFSGIQESVESALREYPIHRLIYTAGGIEEQKMKQTALTVTNAMPELFTPENYTYLELAGTHHHYSTWAAGLWDSIQLMFREDVPPADQLIFTERQSDEEYQKEHGIKPKK